MHRLAVSLKLPEAKKLVTETNKRPLALKDLATIQLEAVTSDIVCLKDVPVDISNWRFGLNRPLPQQHEEVMSQLAQQELMSKDLAWTQYADGLATRLKNTARGFKCSKLCAMPWSCEPCCCLMLFCREILRFA